MCVCVCVCVRACVRACACVCVVCVTHYYQISHLFHNCHGKLLVWNAMRLLAHIFRHTMSKMHVNPHQNVLLAEQ